MTKNTFHYLFTMAAFSLLVACGSSGGSSGGSSNAGPTQPTPPQPPVAGAPISPQYQGLWLAPAYGYGLQILEDSGHLFTYNDTSCFLRERFDESSDAEIESQFKLSDRGLEDFGAVGIRSFHATPIAYQPSNNLPASCEAGFTPVRGEAAYMEDRLSDLEDFYQTFKQYSISLEVKNVDWEGVYAEARTRVSENMSDEAFLEVLMEMITPLADIHTKIETPDGSFFVENKPTQTFIYLNEFLEQNDLELPISVEQAEEANAYIEAQFTDYNDAIFAYAEEEQDVTITANDKITWFQNEGIGYLNISSMFGFSNFDIENINEDIAALDSALDAALTELQDTRGLILDIRTNGGGRDILALAVASRFVTSETLVMKKDAGLMNNRTAVVNVTISPRGAVQYLNPVILLVSASTVSGAETLALSMSALDQVTLVGEATQGAFSDVLTHNLANGFVVNLSNERYFSADDDWFEGQGVPVDLTVPVFAPEDRASGVDSVIGRAIELLGE